jgi:methylthioribulose-1-phosphate dehydratase
MLPQPGSDPLATEADALCAVARWCAARGWVPATSGNFSVRDEKQIRITRSGVDKGALTVADLLAVELDGRAIDGPNCLDRPSAETGLHAVIYRERPEARAILHVHTIWNTLLSGRFAVHGYLSIEGYELLKALAGVTTHEHLEQVPILENTQDYEALAASFASTLLLYPRAHGVLLSRHGLYTWGNSVAEARRHLEALEFLFEVEGRRLHAAGQPVVPDILE